MTEQLKQSISALLDDEASEIEVHRLLREFDGNPELKVSWIRYSQIRAVSQDQHHLSESQHLSLHSRISDAIREEDEHEQLPQTEIGWRRQAAGFAVAASLVAAVLVGVNMNPQAEFADPAIVNNQTPTLMSPAPRGVLGSPIDAQTVSTSDFVTDNEISFTEDEPELRELDEVKQQQLREYLMRHDRMSRLNNNARTVNYPGKN